MIVLRGVDRFIAGVDVKIEQMRKATQVATARALHLIERKAKEKLGLKSHQKGTPTPSGPGEPPALITGNLRRSITVTGPEPVTRNSWRGEVGPTAIYGRVQEMGGPTGRGILPARPYLQPSYDELKEDIRSIFAKAWAEATLK